MSEANKTILIIGNGPSTKELVEYGLQNIPKNVDTFGMGLAHKFYSRAGWWPTYYVCADKKVVMRNEVDFRKLVSDESNKIKKFYFPLEFGGRRCELVPHGSTGNFAFKKSIELGYEQILIIGIDLDYKPLKEATRLTRSEFNELGLDVEYETNVIYKIRTPIQDHPNYFFPDYQEVGDIYSEPRGNSWHSLAWWRERELAESKGLAVRVVGKDSLLKYFVKVPLEAAFKRKAPYPVVFPKMSSYIVGMDIFNAEKALSDEYLREIDRLQKELQLQKDINNKLVNEDLRRSDIVDKLLGLEDAATFLRLLASHLILEPAKTLRKITDDAQVANKVAASLSGLNNANALKVHFLKVLAYAQSILCREKSLTSDQEVNFEKAIGAIASEKAFDVFKEATFDELESYLFTNLKRVKDWVSFLDDIFNGYVAEHKKFDSIYKSKLSNFRQIKAHDEYFSRSVELDKNVPALPKGHSEKLLTFVIAIKNRDRRANISVQNIADAFGEKISLVDIVVVEDFSSGAFVNATTVPDLQHYVSNVGSPTSIWNKSVLLNHGLRVAKTKYVVMSDCDFLYSNVKQLLEVMYHYRDHDNKMFHFPLHESHQTVFKEGAAEKRRPVLYPYSYVWVFNKERVLEINGFNEEFVGWGFEETDLIRRVLSNGSHLIYLPNPRAYHLSHDDSTRVRNDNNREIFNQRVLVPKNEGHTNFDVVDKKTQSFVRAFVTRISGEIDILGNGPSTKGYNFKSKNVKMGFNVAYRYWDRHGVYPNIYVCLDKVVCAHHASEIKRLVEKSPIEYFVLDDVYFDIFGEDRNNARVIGYSSFRNMFALFKTKHITTGTFGVRLAITLGFRKLNIWGMSGDYVNVIEGAEKVSLEESGLPITSIFSSSSVKGDVLRLTETPKNNPNYFFEDYQLKGDIYNYPYHAKPYVCHCDFHKSKLVSDSPHQYGWDLLDHDLRSNGMDVAISRN